MSVDDALQVLGDTYDQLKLDFPKRVVEQSYRVLRMHQYDDDSEIRINELRRIVTIRVEEEFKREKSTS